jgi:hypothetical protein
MGKEMPTGRDGSMGRQEHFPSREPVTQDLEVMGSGGRDRIVHIPQTYDEHMATLSCGRKKQQSLTESHEEAVPPRRGTSMRWDTRITANHQPLSASKDSWSPKQPHGFLPG